jgi:hypothetical protein
VAMERIPETAARRACIRTVAVCTAYIPPNLVPGAHFRVSSLTEVSRALRSRTIWPGGPSPAAISAAGLIPRQPRMNPRIA